MGKIATFALLFALFAPASAGAAANVIVPPGNSEADQYYETLPGATGPRGPDTTKKARDAFRDGALGEGVEQALRQRGPAGLALATAVARTAPVRGGAGARPRGGPPQTPRVPGESGMGAAFPLLLLLAAVGALAFAIARRRGLVTR